MYAVSASRRLRSAGFGLRSAALSSREMAPTTSPRSRVRRAASSIAAAVSSSGAIGGLGEVMAPLLGPIAVQIGPALMHRRRSSRVERSTTADLIIGCRNRSSPRPSLTSTR